MRFAPGRSVVRRQFMRGHQLGRVWVGRVAADDDRGLWLWITVGSDFRDVAAADGRAFREVPFGEWGGTPAVLRELSWRGNDVLMLHPHGAAHSVWFFFDRADEGGGAFLNWYVNLERPIVRWDDGVAAGVDTVDHDLDVVVGRDRSWRWKDEDEFAHHLAWPHVYWVDDATRVRAEGERVIELVEAGGFPFDGTGVDFRPDPGWVAPGLPAGWDRERAW